MTAPEEYTRQQAADPSTPPQTLADIAALRQDLRPVVALNPAAYPGLLDWLASLGEPGVDSALRQRREQTAGDSATARPEAPWTLPAAAGPRTDAPEAAGSGGVPVGLTGPFGASSSAAPGAASPYPAPGASPYGPPAGAPPSGFPGGPASAGGVPTPPASGSRKTLWIVLGAVGGVVLLAIAAVVLLGQLLRGVVSELDETGFGGATYGEDAELDALWDACAAEDWEACDELYLDSPGGSEYEEFGGTCGYRTAGEEWCVDELG